MHILISAVSAARHPSGICRHAANLAASLADAREISRVTLLLGSWQDAYFRHKFGLRHAKLRMVAVEVRNNPCSRNVWYYRTLPKLARQYCADVVHLSFPVPLARRRHLCPVLVSLHDLYPYDMPENFGAVRVLFNRAFLRQCLRESDAVVCSSEFTLGRLQSVEPQACDKAVRIYQSVTIDPRRSRMPSIPAINGRPFLLAVAQHRRNKNLSLLISAFAGLRERDESSRRLRLLIVGADGPETWALHDLIRRYELQKDVAFQKALSDAELCWLYRNCAVLVAPSSIEGFGLPVAEALRCGGRVLCSDIPIFREIGGARCSYFSLGDDHSVIALIDAVRSVLHEPAIEAATSNRFCSTEIAQQHIALYSRLIAGECPLPPEMESVRYAGHAS